MSGVGGMERTETQNRRKKDSLEQRRRRQRRVKLGKKRRNETGGKGLSSNEKGMED